jgi:hypothetical protein
MQTQSSKIIIALVIGILTLAAGESSNGDNRPDAADTIFKNGNVYAGMSETHGEMMSRYPAESLSMLATMEL